MAKSSRSSKPKCPPAVRRLFTIGDDVLVGKSIKNKGVTGEVTGYFMNSNSHCLVMTSSLGRLIVPQEELSAVPLCPWRQALTVLVGVKPPDWVRGNFSKLDEERHDALTDWIGTNLQPSMEWSTAIGVVDAVGILVKEAVSNGNFRSYPGYAAE